MWAREDDDFDVWNMNIQEIEERLAKCSRAWRCFKGERRAPLPVKMLRIYFRDLLFFATFNCSLNSESLLGANAFGGLPSPHSLLTPIVKAAPASILFSVLNNKNESSSDEGLNVK